MINYKQQNFKAIWYDAIQYGFRSQLKYLEYRGSDKNGGYRTINKLNCFIVVSNPNQIFKPGNALQFNFLHTIHILISLYYLKLSLLKPIILNIH